MRLPRSIPQQLFFYFQKAVAEKRRRGIPAAVIIVHVKHFSQRFQLVKIEQRAVRIDVRYALISLQQKIVIFPLVPFQPDPRELIQRIADFTGFCVNHKNTPVSEN